MNGSLDPFRTAAVDLHHTLPRVPIPRINRALSLRWSSRPEDFHLRPLQSVAISRCASANATLPSQARRQSFASRVSLRSELHSPKRGCGHRLAVRTLDHFVIGAETVIGFAERGLL
jgi:hypothetical protein